MQMNFSRQNYINIFSILFLIKRKNLFSLQVLVSNSCANDVSASKQTAASTEAINNKKFMPSYKVLFRRSGRKKNYILYFHEFFFTKIFIY